ncbi:hypothetical protein PPACK8108_LOCUS23115 [Phakopsora pachyrhizi]|uniref:Uncharacterized protein n=1 Tax=Phakopsora pachyrhizi TaxID=170000 RepID=A0AAV0BLK5_PHAPC|nr:hypothetical protein PPACK8108_LOCUS23115 [Phakopsora pachyrhizi]
MSIEIDSDCEEGVEEEECSIKEYSKDNMDDSEASWSSEYSDSLKKNISGAFSEPSTEGKSEECSYQKSGISNHRFSSSWDLRIQMIKVEYKSYYIYEPAQLKDGNVVVCKLDVFVLSSSELQISISGDLDFYASDLKEIMAQDFLKLYIEIKAHDGRSLADKCRNILLGKMIRHIPLNIYSDDTSGNLSKQWNKHISIYMTLSGLPPKYSNQEYNTMFVATSNIASALELCAPVVEELNTLSSTGFWAYDSSLNEDADNKKEKATANYVQRSIGHNSKGFQVCDNQYFLISTYM